MLRKLGEVPYRDAFKELAHYLSQEFKPFSLSKIYKKKKKQVEIKKTSKLSPNEESISNQEDTQLQLDNIKSQSIIEQCSKADRKGMKSNNNSKQTLFRKRSRSRSIPVKKGEAKSFNLWNKIGNMIMFFGDEKMSNGYTKYSNLKNIYLKWKNIGCCDAITNMKNNERNQAPRTINKRYNQNDINEIFRDENKKPFVKKIFEFLKNTFKDESSINTFCSTFSICCCKNMHNFVKQILKNFTLESCFKPIKYYIDEKIQEFKFHSNDCLKKLKKVLELTEKVFTGEISTCPIFSIKKRLIDANDNCESSPNVTNVESSSFSRENHDNSSWNTSNLSELSPLTVSIENDGSLLTWCFIEAELLPVAITENNPSEFSDMAPEENIYLGTISSNSYEEIDSDKISC